MVSQSQRAVIVAAARPSSSQRIPRRQRQMSSTGMLPSTIQAPLPPPNRRSSSRGGASTAWWDALDVTATLGAVAGALAFVVTQEVSWRKLDSFFSDLLLRRPFFDLNLFLPPPKKKTLPHRSSSSRPRPRSRSSRSSQRGGARPRSWRQRSTKRQTRPSKGR